MIPVTELLVEPCPDAPEGAGRRGCRPGTARSRWRRPATPTARPRRPDRPDGHRSGQHKRGHNLSGGGLVPGGFPARTGTSANPRQESAHSAQPIVWAPVIDGVQQEARRSQADGQLHSHAPANPTAVTIVNGAAATGTRARWGAPHMSPYSRVLQHPACSAVLSGVGAAARRRAAVRYGKRARSIHDPLSSYGQRVHGLPGLPNSPRLAPARNACHPADVNLRMAPSGWLLSRTPIWPSGRRATSTQLLLAKLRELLIQREPEPGVPESSRQLSRSFPYLLNVVLLNGTAP